MLSITITQQPTGAVVALGGDGLAHHLLERAGFKRHSDWHGLRHRLAAQMEPSLRDSTTAHAVDMLTAARYEVRFSPGLGERLHPLGDRIRDLSDAVRGAEDAVALGDHLRQLLDPEHGALVRVQEAVQAAAEQVKDLAPEAYELPDRLEGAADLLWSVSEDLKSVPAETASLGPARDVAVRASQVQTSGRGAGEPALPPVPPPAAGRGGCVR
ncbi:hypothetical protein ACWIG4_24180 [Streptomyces sp. NPDC002248]